MKRTKTLILLAVVLVVLCGIIAAEKLVTRHVDTINTVDEVVFTTDASALTSVDWETEDGSLCFNCTDGVWTSSDDADFPVNPETMSEFLENFAEIHASFIIEDVEDYDQYGLKEPQCTITFTTADGASVLNLGGYSTMDAKRYVSTGDGRVFLVNEDPMEVITTQRDDFMQQDTVPAFAQVTEVLISGDTTLDMVYDEEGVYSYTDTYHWYDISTGDHCAIKDSLAEDFVDTLKGLALTDYVTYTASDADFEEYGLDDAPLTFTTKGNLAPEEDSEEDAVGEAAEFTIRISAVDTGEKDDDDNPVMAYYAAFDGSSIIYNLTESRYESLADACFNTLRPPEVFSLDWESVTGFSFTIDDGTYTAVKGLLSELEEEETTETADTEDAAAAETDASEDKAADTSEGSDEEEEPVYIVNRQELPADAIQAAVDALTITEFDSSAQAGEQEVSITIQTGVESFPTLKLVLYRYDGDNCVAVLNGETLGLLSRTQMSDLKEALTSAILSLQ